MCNECFVLISTNQNIPPNTTFWLFIYCLLQAVRSMLHVSTFHASHFQAMFLQGKSRSFSPLRACTDWDLSRLYTSTSTICNTETNNQTCVRRTFYWLIYVTHNGMKYIKVNPLKPELNPICYLLAVLGAHHFLHVSRIRVKSLTFRRLMSYIYIYGAPILDVSRSHTTTQHSR